jgi:hypothetical protein
MAAQPGSVYQQDNAWKDALNRYFPEFIAFFFPTIHLEIDWSRGYEFLDQELAQIARNHQVGRRLADKLVRVWLRDGREQWLLIHVEIQARARADLGKRVFIYHYRLFDRYNCEVVSLAVITGGGARYQPQPYQTARWGCELRFRFPVIKLVDYAARWEALQASPNPFDIVVMTHLRAQQAGRDAQRKFAWKRELVYLLYERGYRRDDMRALFRFID